MIIRTNRRLLRLLTPEDLDSTCRYALDKESIPMMVYFPKLSRREVAEFLHNAQKEAAKERPDYYELAILREGEHIGGISLYFDGYYDRGELGWLLRRDCRGFGYAEEAARGVMQYFSEVFALKRFIAQCDTENSSSRRVIQKLGMRLVEVHSGRKNRCSDEERQEELYEWSCQDKT